MMIARSRLQFSRREPVLQALALVSIAGGVALVACGDGAASASLDRAASPAETANVAPPPSGAPAGSPSPWPSPSPSDAGPSAPAPSDASAPPTGQCAPGQTGTYPDCVTPAPAPGGRSCPAFPAFPDAQCTGIPSGTTLTPSGNITVNTAGTVIDARDVSGTITINANDVTIKRTRVRSTAFAPIRIADKVTGALIEDCEVDGLSGGDNTNAILGPATIRRCNIHDVENGITPGSGSVVEDNFIHDLHAVASPHYDGIQMDGGLKNIVIRHNSVTCPPGQTSAIMLDNCFGSIDGVTITENYLAGGGFTLYHAANFPNHYDPTCAGQAHLTNISITNNRFGPSAYGAGLVCRDAPAAWSGNADATTGTTIGQPKLDVPAVNCPFND